ncbi:plastocyanin/azurin family copper-binding protein [Streptomyces luteireticuli]
MTRADTPTWTRGRRIPAVLMAVTAAVVPLGCSGGGGGGHAPASSAAAPTATSPTAAPSTPKAATKVTIVNFAYDPSPLTVGKGTTVTWTNNDEAPHTVTSDGSGPLHSPTFGRGGTYSYTFDSVGTFTYYCTVHPNMHGTVVVK